MGRCSKKATITNTAVNTFALVASILFSQPSTLHHLLIKPQHFTLLTCFDPLVRGLRWTVGFLAPRRSIRHCKHIFYYGALARLALGSQTSLQQSASLNARWCQCSQCLKTAWAVISDSTRRDGFKMGKKKKKKDGG